MGPEIDPLLITQVSPSEAPGEATRTLERATPSPLAALVRIENQVAVPPTYRLREGSCRIGAGHDVDVVVRDPTVSRVHVELTLVPEGVEVRDCGSHNGTFWLGQRIERVRLGLGSRIRIGHTDVLLGADDPTPSDAELVKATSYGGLHGVSAAMRRTFGVLRRLEGSLVTVLIEGESGTGKELLARALHDHSKVSDGPFVAVDCGALERALARSELFGHRRGAFTGAVGDHVGAFESAEGGTLFLDEIGELPLEVQPLLLRALENGAYQRLGDTAERRAKVRVVAATQRVLRFETAAGHFREDLYHRLNVVRVVIPPLRERLEDVEALARHFCEWLGLSAPSASLLSQLSSRAWPGNVRELKNALAAYSVLGALPGVDAPASADLDATLRRLIDPRAAYAEQNERFNRVFLQVYLERLLALTGGNASEAARISGLGLSYLNRVLNRGPSGE